MTCDALNCAGIPAFDATVTLALSPCPTPVPMFHPCPHVPPLSPCPTPVTLRGCTPCSPCPAPVTLRDSAHRLSMSALSRLCPALAQC
eukprot:866603-Amorphochlora_amoeboformis.AAC.1